MGDLPRPFSQSVNSRECTARSTPYGPISVLLRMETGTKEGTAAFKSQNIQLHNYSETTELNIFDQAQRMGS